MKKQGIISEPALIETLEVLTQENQQAQLLLC